MPAPVFAEVAVNVPQVSGVFHYHVPADLGSQAAPGCLVVAPFGPREVQGIILRLVERAEIKETRALLSVLDAQPVVTAAQMELARWMADESLTPLAACFIPMLPPGIGQQSDILYHLNADRGNSQDKSLGSTQARLVSLLEQRGDLRGRQIETAMPHQAWKAAARALQKRGWIAARPILLPPSVRPKTVRTVQLACTPTEAEARMETVARPGTGAYQRRQAILRFLIREPFSEAAWVYAASGGTLADLHKLAEDGLVVLGENETWRDPLDRMTVVQAEPPELTPQQQAVWDAIRAGVEQAAGGEQPVAPFLLHGITGSGKTEIYLRAVAETLARGRQAIVLVPEISLTPQTVRRFLARFPGQVGLVHSRLSEGERYDTWRRARNGALKVIVGPRSALFAPLPNPGLIVIDECHDGAYYQDDTSPNYHAVDCAVAYARLTSSVLLMGSATPEVGLYYRAAQEKWRILNLPVRILAHRQAANAQRAELGLPPLPAEPARGGENSVALNLPPVKVIDMRRELKEGNRTIFSRELQAALGDVLDRKQQAILFLNRRGTATYVFCRACGYSLVCPRCDLPLTYHADQDGLICHTCNYRRQVPKTCPQCQSPQIRQFGTGTEKVESEVRAMFPQARTLRWDFETTRAKGAHDVLLQTFSERRADVLVGTQMLAKGLDLPLVTLVGVVLADVGLALPDYNAGERTFQLLTQVAGRAGRSLLGGRVILQTFQPDHYAIRAAAHHDYARFYQQEIAYRRRLGYPPFAKMVRLEARHADAERAEAAALEMEKQIRCWIEEGGFKGTSLIGPAPCFFGRQNSQYRWQIILRGPNPIDVLRSHPLGDWRVEIGPTSLL